MAATSAAGSFATPFARDAIDYLKTRGLLPLWAGITRPILPWNLKAALDVGQGMQQLAPLSAADRAVLMLLDPAYDPTDASPGLIRHAIEASLVASYGMPRAYTQLSASSDSSLAMGGWAVNSPTAAVAAQSGGVSWRAGRTPLGWGPAPLGSELSFDEAAGGFDALELSFVWLRARFTKVVGWLDTGHSIVGTRMDIPYRPNLRLGFGESIVMAGTPYLPYVLNPIPIGINPPLMAQFRLPQGIVDNIDLTADMDWVPEPGVRVFGEVFVDDVTVPTPTVDLPSKWGFTGGFHVVYDDGSSVQGLYTIVLNWTYTETTGLNFALRGLPLGHVLGPDFDLIHLRWMSSPPPANSTWVAYVRKGPGKVGVIWPNQTEAWQKLFLSGVVEHSLMAGFDTPFDSAGWIGKIGPWAAYRVNADHVAGATRVDWGVNLEAAWSN
jgi:hypothetical protein